jgi:beta-lactamase regulating signal transducer with metallopeptidase domain/thiol-disulfide isomerase/thioredoxin
MTWFSPFVFGDNTLLWVFNAAVTSTLACAIALILCGMRGWSLPVRHALLVVAIGASLLLPWGIGLVPVSTPWAVEVQHTMTARSEGFAAPIRGSSDVEPSDATAIATPAMENAPAVSGEPVKAADQGTPGSSPAVAAPVVNRSVAPVRYLPIAGTILCGVWLVGIGATLVRGVMGLIRLRRWLRSTFPVEDEELLAAAREAARRMGLPADVSVHESQALVAPVTLGLFRPRIVVPASLASTLSPQLLKAVLLHEVAHVARRDLWVGLLQQLAQMVYWWNPLVHAASRQLADCREQICDDIATGDLPEPWTFAAALLEIAERATLHAAVPATLGIGSSSESQLEKRIRRILLSPASKAVGLSRGALVGVLTVALLMTATILFAQVRVKPPAGQPANDPPEAKQAETKAPTPNREQHEPTLRDLIQKMAEYERMYLPYDIKAMETFRFPDDLTPQERAKNLRADGRKHQRLMEQAQAKRRIWRRKETPLVDDEVEFGSYEQYSDGERIISKSPSPIVIDGVKTYEYHVNNKRNQIFNYEFARPLSGVFCLSTLGNGELFSEAFATEEDVELAWDNGDARLTFGYGKPHWNMKFVLWLSRAHDWHPIRLQRFMDAKDELFFDEWEVTDFVQKGNVWRIAKGTQRYRNHAPKNVPLDPRFAYFMDFEILEEKYGPDVDATQFQIEIPAGAKVRDDDKPAAEPPPPAKTREITVTVVDLADQPIPAATVRLPRWPFADIDVVTTDAQGVARSAKAPADDVSVKITAAGYRPVTWIIGNVNELRAIMAPVSSGVVVCRGKPVADAWIKNAAIQIRADGIPYVPQRDWDGKNDDWSSEDGRYELKSDLTLQRKTGVVPFIAIDPDGDKMAVQFVPTKELGQEQMIELKPVCHVHGQCLLRQMTESVQVGASIETSDGNYVGFLPTRRKLISEGLQVEFEVRLPAGRYVLKTGETAFHAGFEIPFTIDEDQRKLELETKDVPLAGLAALKGGPAPLLDVKWRADEQATWEELRGQVVVLDFWGTWCAPCVASMPTLMDIQQQFRDQKVRWIAIHTPDQKSFEEFDRDLGELQESAWNKRALPFTTVIDVPTGGKKFAGRTSEAYGISEWPTLIVIDQQGKVVGSVTKKNLADTIRRLLEEGIHRGDPEGPERGK